MCISCALAGFPEQIVGLVVFSAQISLSPHLQRAIDTDNIATPASSSSSCAVAWRDRGESPSGTYNARIREPRCRCCREWGAEHILLSGKGAFSVNPVNAPFRRVEPVLRVCVCASASVCVLLQSLFY
jgi:hypothetical protein